MLLLVRPYNCVWLFLMQLSLWERFSREMSTCSPFRHFLSYLLICFALSWIIKETFLTSPRREALPSAHLTQISPYYKASVHDSVYFASLSPFLNFMIFGSFPQLTDYLIYISDFTVSFGSSLPQLAHCKSSSVHLRSNPFSSKSLVIRISSCEHSDIHIFMLLLFI